LPLKKNVGKRNAFFSSKNRESGWEGREGVKQGF